MPFYFDPTYILIIIAYVITLWAQIKVKSAYAKYSKISNRAGLTGTDAAYAVLRSGGVTNVPVKAIAGELTDHYDPRDNTISLSSGVISTPSIAAVGVAAHEAGHALQYAEGYAPIKLRMAIVPVCNIASQLAWPIFFIGLMLNAYGDSGSFLMRLGIFAFSFAVLFQAVTLPVELNASRRALRRKIYRGGAGGRQKGAHRRRADISCGACGLGPSAYPTHAHRRFAHQQQQA